MVRSKKKSCEISLEENFCGNDTLFLDASKAYDRVDDNMLFKKMILCNIPLCLVCLLL